MNTCGTCKFFGKVKTFEEWRDDEDEPRVNTRLHVCGLLKHLNESSGSPLSWTAPAGVIDGSGYFAALCVSDEFGCNQWAPTTSGVHK